MESVFLELSGKQNNSSSNMYRIDVPGLAEKRPSVLRGDHVVVIMEGNNNNRAFKGVTHFVNLDHLILSMHRDFNGMVACR